MTAFAISKLMAFSRVNTSRQMPTRSWGVVAAQSRAVDSEAATRVRRVGRRIADREVRTPRRYFTANPVRFGVVDEREILPLERLVGSQAVRPGGLTIELSARNLREWRPEPPISQSGDRFVQQLAMLVEELAQSEFPLFVGFIID